MKFFDFVKTNEKRLAIKCRNNFEKLLLLEELERQGYTWYAFQRKPTEICVKDIGNVIVVYNDEIKRITHSTDINDNEFVLPFGLFVRMEKSAGEILDIIYQNYSNEEFWIEAFGENLCFIQLFNRYNGTEIAMRVEHWLDSKNN